MQNQNIIQLIENLKGRKSYEEKKASKLGFSSLYNYFEDKILKEKQMIEDKKKELLRDGIRPLVINLTNEEKSANQVYLKKMEDETGVKPRWLSTKDGE